MSKRNIIWLAVIVVVGAVVWIATSWWLGLLAAVAVLVVSEFVERQARTRRQIAKGVEPSSPLGDAVASRRKRR